jgi:hypothetical protein
VDDIVVAESYVVPLDITSPSALPNALATYPYSAPMQKVGGSPGSVWSIVNGTNHGWLSISPTTGALTGTPAAGNLGPFSVTIRVEEPALPSNFDEQVFTGEVVQGVFAETFEGPCPNGWTFGGDWECGVPTGPGPGASYDGTQCIATQIDGFYNDNQPWGTTIATSPGISLSGTTNPQLMFRMWLETEACCDGANLKISTDGVNFSQVMNVVPAYDSSLQGEDAWLGTESALGWQLVTADLTPYAGQTIYLRFAFVSDGSVIFPGVYIDHIEIVD